MTLKITFTEDEIAELFYWKERHPHPRVRKKMSVLYLKSQQLTHKEIKRLERITEATLLAYLNAYLQPNGLEALKELNSRDIPPKPSMMLGSSLTELLF
ncbi:MAG: hypothetical protein QJT81_00445 [Candidatus Thiothrix putei]|uniref:Uncharacterized protein n=1 Tax=Candidatus Thiothrix putei TaxID=3080811 RepID=A0AA95KPZ9_9GAMM|nr:MAG: hypothetical protein QJT81_00445 [Candidatus Thiothrix putei]